MNQAVVAVLDGTRARFFTLETAEFPEYESSPNLVEHQSLSNNVKELAGKDLWANTKTGRNRGSRSQGHRYDDHRQNHLSEFERSFAKEVETKIINLIQERDARQLLLVAEPQMLGFIRDSLTPHLPKTIKVQELAKDLCKLKPFDIHEYLAHKNLIPARKVVTI
ncbi:MAG TPA: host attachment protein [Cyanothece sp. UBA12306]|nr:host attachment protein [Cyanothece sp. UBA12306]